MPYVECEMPVVGEKKWVMDTTLVGLVWSTVCGYKLLTCRNVLMQRCKRSGRPYELLFYNYDIRCLSTA
jgi:hypothetical protein